MKFLHLGDLHLGKSLGDFRLIEDQKYILDSILKKADDEKADAVIVAGDVYDKSIPTEEAVNLLNDFLSELQKRGIMLFMISGNHDSDDRLKYGDRIFANSNLYICSKFEGTLSHVTVEDKYGEVCVYMLPFVKASQVRAYYPDADISTYEDAVRTIIENTDIDSSKRNIMVAHQFVAGKSDPALAGSEGLAAVNVGLVERIGADVFEAFDYTALGHIHRAQEVTKDTIRYCGSPLKYSLSEINTVKSMPIVEMKEKGNTVIELAELIPQRDVRHLRGTLMQLTDVKNISDPDDFIYATLLDENVIEDAMGLIRQNYPNTVKIDYDNSHSKESEGIETVEDNLNKPFDVLISDFYRSIFGCDMSDEEKKVMLKAAAAAGVINETD